MSKKEDPPQRMVIPTVTETISSYIMSEEGKISKQALITLGAFLGGAALAAFFEAGSAEGARPVCFSELGDSCIGPNMCGTTTHCNNVDVHFDGARVRGHHSHHSSY